MNSVVGSVQVTVIIQDYNHRIEVLTTEPAKTNGFKIAKEGNGFNLGRYFWIFHQLKLCGLEEKKMMSQSNTKITKRANYFLFYSNLILLAFQATQSLLQLFCYSAIYKRMIVAVFHQTALTKQPMGQIWPSGYIIPILQLEYKHTLLCMTILWHFSQQFSGLILCFL